MAPRTDKTTSVVQKRKAKTVKNIEEKLIILDLLKSGEKVASVAKKYNVNESTIRSIRQSEDKIRKNALHLGSRAKYAKVSRNGKMVKMEDMLIDWLQDSINSKIPVNSVAIRDQAVNFYSQLKENSESSNTNESFCASKGWYERFKNRFSLTFGSAGEIVSMSVDEAESQESPQQHLISERIYLPEQDLNNDEVEPLPENAPARAYLAEDPLNSSWSKFLPEIVVKDKVAQAVSNVLHNTKPLAKEIDNEVFDSAQNSSSIEANSPKIRTCVNGTEDEAENLAENEGEEPKEDEQDCLTVKSLAKIFKKMQNVIRMVQEQDPDMKRSLKFKHDCESALLPYQELHRDLLRRHKKKHLN